MGFYLHDRNAYEDLIKANARQELKVAQYEDILQKSDPLQILENYSKYQ